MENIAIAGSRAPRPLLAILKTAVFSGVLISVVSAFVIEMLGNTREMGISAIAHPADILKATVLLLPITMVSSSWFGFLAGGLGTALIYSRRRAIRSKKGFLIRCATLGLIAGICFPYADSLVNGAGLRLSWSLLEVLTSILFGPLCALLCAAIFGKHIWDGPSNEAGRSGALAQQ
jgi:hypothetical protein